MFVMRDEAIAYACFSRLMARAASRFDRISERGIQVLPLSCRWWLLPGIACVRNLSNNTFQLRISPQLIGPAGSGCVCAAGPSDKLCVQHLPIILAASALSTFAPRR